MDGGAHVKSEVKMKKRAKKTVGMWENSIVNRVAMGNANTFV